MAHTSTVKSAVICCVILFLFAAKTNLYAQANFTSDELLIEARKEAFEKSSYPRAAALLKQALVKSPDYADIRIFLGRIYTWTNKLDSAAEQFGLVLTKNPQNKEALNAGFDLYYWNDNSVKALEYANSGLKYYPESAEFTIKKIKALNALSKHDQALHTAETYLLKNPGNSQVRSLQETIKIDNLKNKIGVGYSYAYFDKRFTDAWQQSYISYGRRTKYGPITVSLNYANRFATRGAEYEIEAYPHLDTGLYAYVGGGYSQSDIFSKYRIGFTLYKNLGRGFEAEAGVRFLHFSSTTTILVPGFGKYIGNNYIGLRSYIIPYSGNASVSFTLLTRFYLKDNRNDFFGISLGTGVSPDDRARRFDIVNNLKSFKAGADYSKNLTNKIVLTASGSLIYEEYFTNTHGNQYSISAGIQKRF